ncbi:RNA dependent RNA polymerase-domain-containing protein [Nemania abortiva]|nr:RNA dependent RNA polymerase-domain-containing protein [Nemania abortiva]
MGAPAPSPSGRPVQPAQPLSSTSSGNGSGRRGAPTTQRSDVRPDWRDWDDLTIRISFLPPLTTTLHLVTYFKRHGNVTFTEILGVRKDKALVRFSPPPSQPCWGDRMAIEIEGQLHRVRVELLSRRGPEAAATPGGHTYPAKRTLKLAELQFGLFSQPNEFMVMQTIENTPGHDFTFHMDLKFTKLEITFPCIIENPRQSDPELTCISEYKTRIFFSHLANLVVLEEDGSTFSVIIPLQSPPIFFRKGDEKRSHSLEKSSWNESDRWNRTADIVYDTAWFKDDRVSLRRQQHFVDIARWTAYKVTFTKSESNVLVWETMRKALRDFNISIRDDTADSLRTVSARKSKFWETLEPIATGGNLALLAATEDVHLPYDVRYQLEVCISQGYFDEVNLGVDFLRKLTDLSNAQKRNRNRAKDLLTYVAESGGPGAGDGLNLYPKRFYDPMALFTDKSALRYYPELGVPSHCTWVRKVIITPSTMYLSTPNPEPSNRVLRRYAQYSDRFLRVQFMDELVKGRIFSSPKSEQQNALFNRVFRTMANGIEIGGRHFEFLAWGNSQFRENGSYFFSPTDHINCDQIREWMGDVTHIRVVAKYAARLGQCFSTTRALTDSPISQSVEEIEDITRHDWCFTDGVGKISPKLAQYVTRPLRMTRKMVPSAFQFRLGGSKGLLVVWPDLTFNQVSLRPSQQKFRSKSTLLEIIQSSRFSAATLNRQTITILSSLGVPDAAFLELQTTQLIDYDKAMEDPATAMRLLTRFVDQNGVTTMVAQMITDGFMRAREPFFMCILQVWRAWSLRQLREKARIVVEQGAFVFGCVDETYTLRGYREPDQHKNQERSSTGPSSEEFPQIFLQVPRPGCPPDDPSSYMVVTGLCVVGRNPSLHPGDIRIVEAVDVAGLHHLRDVVVFPANGDRDIPSMCSGGDLDGDDFFVIWDRNLIPPERNHPPMIQEPMQPVELNRDVRPSDLIAFFVTYMKNDALSTIALAHLAQADRLEGGPKNPLCVELAQLHSNAVDYPKSGQPAHLKASLRPKEYPHFMEKPGRSYHSRKVLGQLYDVVRKVEFRPNYDGAFDERIIRRFALTDDMLRKARIIKAQHDRALRQIMNQRELGTEFEAWSTFVLTKPRAGSDYKMQETMGPIIANHRERFRNACIRVAGSREPKLLYPFVAAAYHVTWEAVQVAIHKAKGRLSVDQPLPFISFPWIFERELGRIANLDQDYQVDSFPEAAVDALMGAEESDEAEYEHLLGLGVFAPTLEEVDSEGVSVSAGGDTPLTQPTEPEEEVIVLDEVETGLDELEKMMGKI